MPYLCRHATPGRQASGSRRHGPADRVRVASSRDTGSAPASRSWSDPRSLPIAGPAGAQRSAAHIVIRHGPDAIAPNRPIRASTAWPGAARSVAGPTEASGARRS